MSMGPWKCRRPQALCLMISQPCPREKTSEPSGSQKKNPPPAVCCLPQETAFERSRSKCVVYTLSSLSVLRKWCHLHTGGISWVKKSLVWLTRSLYLRVNHKINTPRRRQRAVPHISCHHLQVRGHKSTPSHGGSRGTPSGPYIKHGPLHCILGLLIYCIFRLRLKYPQKHPKIYSLAAPVWKPHCPNNVCSFIICFPVPECHSQKYVPTAVPHETREHREGEAERPDLRPRHFQSAQVSKMRRSNSNSRYLIPPSRGFTGFP